MELDKTKDIEETEEFRRFDEGVKRLFSVSKKAFDESRKQDKLNKINKETEESIIIKNQHS